MRLKLFVFLSFCVLAVSLTTLAQQRGANAPAAEQRPKAAVLIFRESFKGPTPGRANSTALKATKHPTIPTSS